MTRTEWTVLFTIALIVAAVVAFAACAPYPLPPRALLQSVPVLAAPTPTS